MLPIKWANKTRPRIAMSIANAVSPTNVLVVKLWP